MNKYTLATQKTLADLCVKHEDRISKLKEDCRFLLSFAPKGNTPKGLCPTFYHTGMYEGDCELQTRCDAIRSGL